MKLCLATLFLSFTFATGFFAAVRALKCRNCLSVDSSCDSDPIPSCENGDYCTFLNLTIGGNEVLTYKCSKVMKVKVGDQLEFTELNKCLNGSYSAGQYMLKICNDSDFCNTECKQVSMENSAVSTIPSSLVATLLFMAISFWTFKQ